MLVLQAGAVFRKQKPVDVPRSAMLDLNLRSVRAGARTRIGAAVVRLFLHSLTSAGRSRQALPRWVEFSYRTRLSTSDQHSEILERCGVGFVARRIGGIPGG